MTVRLLHPFPVQEVLPHLQKAKNVVVLENNATGQLASLIKLNIGLHEKINSVLKYDGNPFLPSEVYSESKKVLSDGPSAQKLSEELV
ncbi:hypothetical protein D3C81_2122370 [compost metagenome]